MRALGRTLACALVLLATSIGVASAQTAEDDEARTHFEAARLHFERGAYEQAQAEFQAAYDLSHRAELLYNLYLTAERLADFDAAIDYLERYLAEGSPDAERRASLEPRLANLRERRDRHLPQEPVEATSDTTAASATPPPSTRREGDLVPAAIAFGVAGVGLLSFAIFGGLALAEDGSLADRCGTSCTGAEVSTLGTLTIVSDISWITAAVAGVAGLVLALTLGMPSSEQPSASARVLPWAGRDGGGLTIVGRF